MPQGGASANKGSIALQARFEIVEQRAQWTDIQCRQPPPALDGHPGQQWQNSRLGLAARGWREQKDAVAELNRVDRLQLARTQLGPAQSIEDMVAEGRMQLVGWAHKSSSTSSTEDAAAHARSADVISGSWTVGA